jgi:hypothetical protein
VVWEADLSPENNNELEVFGRRVAGDGTLLGAGQGRISTHGEEGDDLIDGSAAAVTFMPSTCQYMTVWEGDAEQAVEGADRSRVFSRAFDAPDCPKPVEPEVKQDQQQQQQQAQPPSPPAAAPLPARAPARTCLSRRRFGVNVRAGPGPVLPLGDGHPGWAVGAGPHRLDAADGRRPAP